MNKQTNKEIKKVVSSMHMGNYLFKSYIQRTNDEKLKIELQNVLDRFESHVNKFKIVTEKYNIKNIDKFSFSQEIGINMQLMKQYKTDFAIVSDALKGLNMGMLGMLDFIYKNKDVDESVKDYAKVVLKDYDILTERLHKFSLETYC